jgi:hypothetical protein
MKQPYPGRYTVVRHGHEDWAGRVILDSQFIMADDGTNAIANVYVHGTKGKTAEDTADLFALAPELLNMLRELVQAVDETGHIDEFVYGCQASVLARAKILLERMEENPK